MKRRGGGGFIGEKKKISYNGFRIIVRSHSGQKLEGDGSLKKVRERSLEKCFVIP